MVVKTKKTKNNKNAWKWVTYISGGMFLIVVFVLGIAWWNMKGSKTDLEKRGFEDRGLSVMEIELNGVSLEEIDSGNKKTRYEDNRIVVYDDGKASEFSRVRIRGRGNGTWYQDKKPYQIKFPNKINLFGLGESRKWVLLANAKDDTHLRNEVAFYMEEMLEMNCVFRGEPIELYVDGDYRGLYYLTRQVEIDKDLVDLRDPFGVVVELDNLYGDYEKYYKTEEGDLLVVKDSVVDENADIIMGNFVNNYNSLRDSVKKKDYDKVKELIDTESFAKYYLLSEFSVNPDAYWTSFFMYKDGFNDRIHAGPGWDFDLAFANKNWGNWMGERFYSPTETMIRKQEIIQRYDADWLSDEQFTLADSISTVIFDLMELPNFREEVLELFRDKMEGRRNEIIKMIEDRAEKIYYAAIADNKRWERKDFEDELKKMIEWIEARYDYFDMVYGDDNSINTGTI